MRDTNSSSTQTITEESVKAMVDESVETSVEGAISQMNAANEAENAEEDGGKARRCNYCKSL